jgi:metal-sulfur cluster biosynthetic enzyme
MTGAIAGDVREHVAAELEAIKDPCSVGMGAPAGLVSMGLVRHVDVDETPAGAHVSVSLCITEPGCWMAGVFCEKARTALLALPQVETVDVHVDYDVIWEPADMSVDYRALLERRRSARRPQGAPPRS